METNYTQSVINTLIKSKHEIDDCIGMVKALKELNYVMTDGQLKKVNAIKENIDVLADELSYFLNATKNQ